MHGNEPRIPDAGRFEVWVVLAHGGRSYLERVVLHSGPNQARRDTFHVCRRDTHQKIPGAYVTLEEFDASYGFTPVEAVVKAVARDIKLAEDLVRRLTQAVRQMKGARALLETPAFSAEKLRDRYLRLNAENKSFHTCVKNWLFNDHPRIKDYWWKDDFEEMYDEMVGSLEEERMQALILTHFGPDDDHGTRS